jgi:hypothetical protein
MVLIEKVQSPAFTGRLSISCFSAGHRPAVMKILPSQAASHGILLPLCSTSCGYENNVLFRTSERLIPLVLCRTTKIISLGGKGNCPNCDFFDKCNFCDCMRQISEK